MDKNRIDWNPCVGGGSNYKSRKLSVKEDKLLFKPTPLNYIFPLMFCGIPTIMLFTIIGSGDNIPLPMIPFLLVFILIGIFVGNLLARPIVIDLNKKIFYKGFKVPKKEKKITKLSNVIALQLLTEYVVSSNSNGGTSRYYSHEINFILKDYKRINIVDHGNKNSIIEDAKIISKTLNIPIVTKD